MSKFEEREAKRKSVVTDIISSGKPKKEKLIPRTFYIRPEQIKAMAFEKAKTGKDLSEIIRESLDRYFDEKSKNTTPTT